MAYDLTVIHERMHAVADAVNQVVLGQERAVQLLTVALFVRGHVLLYGLPGQGKTLLANCFAKAIGGVSERFQGSPDFLFSEAIITASPDENGQLRYYAGRLVRHGERLGIVLLDEINRFMPNTQAGFLEAMQERKVTTANHTYRLPHFIGIATQNPLETAETYPLPEALRDRFLMVIEMRYPDQEQERMILMNPIYHSQERAYDQMESVVRLEELNHYAEIIASKVRLSADAISYIYNLVLATRKPSSFGILDMDHGIVAGVSTRGALQAKLAAQALAVWHGRDYVVPEDVRSILKEVFAHRIFVHPVTLARQPHFVDELIDEIAKRVPVP